MVFTAVTNLFTRAPFSKISLMDWALKLDRTMSFQANIAKEIELKEN
jgi:hypothetical protein